VLRGLATRDPRVSVISHTRAFGAQSAFTSGMRLATGDAVVLLDGDLQDPPELIPKLVERWREGYEVVYAERVDREGRRLKRWAAKVFYRLFRRMSYVDVPVDAGDFGLMDRGAVDALNALPERHRFLRGLRAWVGSRQTGVPFRRPERMFGRSTNSLLKNLGWARRAIISFSYAPLDLIMLLALIVVGASFAASYTSPRASAWRLWSQAGTSWCPHVVRYWSGSRGRALRGSCRSATSSGTHPRPRRRSWPCSLWSRSVSGWRWSSIPAYVRHAGRGSWPWQGPSG
jgi:glycosyltransferase involved in cell wall biosynthesis